MRIYQAGAEGRTLGFDTKGFGNGVEVTTAQKTGGGSRSYLLGAYYFGKVGKIGDGVFYDVGLPNTSGLTKYYYKADMYIDSLSSTAGGLSLFAFRSGGATGQVNTLIYNDGGVLKMVNQYNTNSYWYDAGASRSPVVNLGVGFDTWFRLEVHVDATTPDGSNVCQVKINGVTVINSTNLTFTSPASGEMYFGVTNISGVYDDLDVTTYVDNIAVNDASGLHNNTWVGEEYIVLLQGNAPGDSNPNVGNSSSVFAIPPVSLFNNISGNYVSNSSNTISINLEDPLSYMDADSRVNAVMVHNMVKNNVAGTYEFIIKSASGGSIQTSPTFDSNTGNVARMNPDGTTSYGAVFISERDPSTDSRWRVTGTNSLSNMQVGMNRGMAISSISATVAYSPHVAPTTSGMMIMFW